MAVANDKISSARTLIKILRVIGLWRWRDNPLHRPTCLEVYYPFVLHVLLTFTYIVLMWMEVLISRNLTEAADAIYVSLTELALVVKILNIWYMGAKAWQFMHALDSDSKFTLHMDVERDLWRKKHRTFGFVAFFYIAGSLLVLIAGGVSVLFMSTYQLPFRYWLPFDWRHGDHYWFAYGYGLMAMTLTCISNTTLDMIYCYFMFHVALLYELLGIRLVRLENFEEYRALPELKEIFQLQQRVRKLSHQCESLVAAPVIAQIILSALILCFSGYRLMNIRFVENPGEFFATFQFVVVMILQIFLPCYYANEITIHSHTLTLSVYKTNWLHFSPSTRRFLNVYMESLKRPVQLRVANFLLIGLPIFTKTMNNAYSLFAVLLNMGKSI